MPCSELSYINYVIVTNQILSYVHTKSERVAVKCEYMLTTFRDEG